MVRQFLVGEVTSIVTTHKCNSILLKRAELQGRVRPHSRSSCQAVWIRASPFFLIYTFIVQRLLQLTLHFGLHHSYFPEKCFPRAFLPIPLTHLYIYLLLFSGFLLLVPLDKCCRGLALCFLVSKYLKYFLLVLCCGTNLELHWIYRFNLTLYTKAKQAHVKLSEASPLSFLLSKSLILGTGSICVCAPLMETSPGSCPQLPAQSLSGS